MYLYRAQNDKASTENKLHNILKTIFLCLLYSNLEFVQKTIQVYFQSLKDSEAR